jgi:hypothetical protein
MDSIKVDVDALSTLGALCREKAEALGADRPVPTPGPRFQATAKALDDIASLTARAENLISVRLHVTGHTIVTAADRLANCDSASQQRISAVRDETVV